MIEINNKHIVLMLLIIIIGVFIYNYDIYLIPKNEPLCKPIYVFKRELSPELRAKLNKTESETLKETFQNLSKIEYFENSDGINSNDLDLVPKTFSLFTISSLTNEHKIKVIDSVIKTLSYVPTNYTQSQIKQIVEYFASIYEKSPNIEKFYKNIKTSSEINELPFNTKYSHLILFLIGKFDNDYLNILETNNNIINEKTNEIIKNSDEFELNDTLKMQKIMPNQNIKTEKFSNYISN